ncbi:MAG TPA: hypothetical protein VK843_17005 [Planctomycetota bacterium]|nr:hypothetical protein [Planctomycetota bacterium]
MAKPKETKQHETEIKRFAPARPTAPKVEVRYVRFANPKDHVQRCTLHVGPGIAPLEIVAEPGQVIEVPEEFADAVCKVPDAAYGGLTTGGCPWLQRLS